MTIKAAGEIEFEQHQLDFRRRCAGQSNHFVDSDSDRPEQAFDRRSMLLHQFIGGERNEGFGRLGDAGDNRRPQNFDYVRGILHQSRAVTDQLVAALGARIER